MTVPLRIERKQEAAPLRDHYEEVARDTLRVIWGRKLLIGTFVFAALTLASMALLIMGPWYTAEATIQLDFTREESASGARNQSVAAVDAAALVDGAARVIRSRATASAVVDRFGLDRDPEFAHESFLWRLLSRARAALGFGGVILTPRDLAVDQLMRKVSVTNDPRSYFISVAITLDDPERAAKFANAIALEYLRGQALQQLTDAQADLERDLAKLSSVYGVRHPSYASGRTRLENLQARLAGVRDGIATEHVVEFLTGQSFVAAEKVMVPSGPNIASVLGLAGGGALALGIWVALLLRPNMPVGSKDTAMGERSLEPIRK